MMYVYMLYIYFVFIYDILHKLCMYIVYNTDWFRVRTPRDSRLRVEDQGGPLTNQQTPGQNRGGTYETASGPYH